MDEIEYYLEDDGSLDTVVVCCYDNGESQDSTTFRYDMEYAATWRDHDGVLDFDQFVEDVVKNDAEDYFYG